MDSERIRRLTSGEIPLFSFFEGWNDEVLDDSIWTFTDPSGVAWYRGSGDSRLYASGTMVLNETARIVSDFRIPFAPLLSAASALLAAERRIIKKTIVEFEMYISTVSDLDNTLSFWGLSTSTTDTGAAADLCCFELASDALQTHTDGVTNTTFGETMEANWHKYRIEGGDNQVLFSLDEALIATHDLNDNIDFSSKPMFLNFYFDSEGAGGSVIRLGSVRVWTED